MVTCRFLDIRDALRGIEMRNANDSGFGMDQDIVMNPQTGKIARRGTAVSYYGDPWAEVSLAAIKLFVQLKGHS
jgi:hypothetical protein